MSPLTSRIASFICGSCCSLPVHLSPWWWKCEHVAIYQGRRLARGKKKKFGDNGRQECSTEYDRSKPWALEKVWEHFSVVASERQPRCVGRARSQAVPSSKRITIRHHYPTLSSSVSVIQYSYYGKLSVPNECVLINCASLYAFCNKFQVKMYDFPDHQIWGRTTRFSGLVVRWSTASKC